MIVGLPSGTGSGLADGRHNVATTLGCQVTLAEDSYNRHLFVLWGLASRPDQGTLEEGRMTGFSM